MGLADIFEVKWFIRRATRPFFGVNPTFHFGNSHEAESLCKQCRTAEVANSYRTFIEIIQFSPIRQVWLGLGDADIFGRSVWTPLLSHRIPFLAKPEYRGRICKFQLNFYNRNSHVIY